MARCGRRSLRLGTMSSSPAHCRVAANARRATTAASNTSPNSTSTASGYMRFSTPPSRARPLRLHTLCSVAPSHTARTPSAVALDGLAGSRLRFPGFFVHRGGNLFSASAPEAMRTGVPDHTCACREAHTQSTPFLGAVPTHSLLTPYSRHSLMNSHPTLTAVTHRRNSSPRLHVCSPCE